MPIHRDSIFAGVLFAVTCLAQSPGSIDSLKQHSNDTITTSVGVVIAPTTVRTGKGEFVRDLQIQDFEVYDNDKLQKITADLQGAPFSLVVAIQRSADMKAMLPKVQQTGTALMDLVAGQDGEVAVVGFDHRVQVVQDFTNDSEKVSQAMKELTIGGYNHAAIDAVMESARMLQSRPHDRRRIVLIISEKWDKGSHGSLREALTQAEFANITIYSLDVSTVAAELTSQPMPQRPPTLPTTAYRVPDGAVLTPTTIDQTYYLGNWVPLFQNMFHSVKNAFTYNTLQALTHFTGGSGYPFNNERTLDKAILNLSEDVHGQYFLSYAPNDLSEGGFHQIRIVVKPPGRKIQTRPGYWVAGKPE